MKDNTKNKKNIIIIAVILVIMAAAIAILLCINASQGTDVERGHVAVTQNGEIVKEFTMEDIEQMEYTEFYKKIVSSSSKDVEGTFRGPTLADVLTAADENILDGAENIIVRSEDDFVSQFSVDEIMQKDNIILAYSVDGESLGDMDNGGSGPYRVVINEDAFGNRSAMYVCELEVE